AGAYTVSARPVVWDASTYRPTITLCSASSRCSSPSHGLIIVKAHQRVTVRVAYAVLKPVTPPSSPSPGGSSQPSPEGKGTLASKRSESGIWSATISEAAGAPQTQADGVVSLPIPLAEEEKIGDTHRSRRSPSTSRCSGRWDSSASGAKARGGCCINPSGQAVMLGEFLEVEPPRRVFTWGWEREMFATSPQSTLVEVSLTPDGDGTIVQLAHRRLQAAAVVFHRAGWEHYLPRLALVASGVERSGDGPICVRLDRPPVNALDLELVQAITAAIARAIEEGARAVVLTGQGHCFCAGIDTKLVPTYTEEQRRAAIGAINTMVSAVYGAPVPIVAALNG